MKARVKGVLNNNWRILIWIGFLPLLVGVGIKDGCRRLEPGEQQQAQTHGMICFPSDPKSRWSA